MHRYRTHDCGALRSADVGRAARLSGWVHRVRDHGGLLFIDLRDHYGLTQCVVDPDSAAFAAAEKVRAEWVIRVDGEVKRRAEGTINTSLPTGEVEIFIREIEVLSAAEELPLPVFGEPDYPEDIRLRYRFVDLRRETLHRNIVLRSKIITSIRRRMVDSGFTEYQTPILTASSPEGARDFLVPSRLHPGRFYALPQAPQQFKQLIMVAGFDRYFQIAPCFRDEDARADRSPGEFYQLDIEMSFVMQEDVFAAVEPVLRGLFEEFSGGWAVTPEFPRIPYMEAIQRYGTDKPDLRNPIEMQDVSDIFRDAGFRLFRDLLAAVGGNAAVWAIPAPGGGSRAFCDRMNSWAQDEGHPGLGYIFFRNEPLTSDEFTNSGLAEAFQDSAWTEGEHPLGVGPIASGIGRVQTERLRRHFGLSGGDALFFVGGNPDKFYPFAGQARDRIGAELGLTRTDRFEFCWIVDYPMFEWDEEERQIGFSHNPFSMPQGGLGALETMDPLEVLAHQYDLVCNGVELSSGAIRNHKPEIMEKAFAIAGYDRSVLEEKFAGMYRAFKAGAPPHGGIAPGIDRIVMLLARVGNLREVTMFPMTQTAEDLMMGAPSAATARQLAELHIQLSRPAAKRP